MLCNINAQDNFSFITSKRPAVVKSMACRRKIAASSGGQQVTQAIILIKYPPSRPISVSRLCAQFRKRNRPESSRRAPIIVDRVHFRLQILARLRNNGALVVTSSGMRMCANTRRFALDEQKELYYRVEVQNRVYKREIVEVRPLDDPHSLLCRPRKTTRAREVRIRRTRSSRMRSAKHPSYASWLRILASFFAP